MMAYYRHAKAQFEAALDDAVVGASLDPIPASELSRPGRALRGLPLVPVQLPRQSGETDDALPLVAGISRRSAAAEGNDVTTMRALSGLNTRRRWKA